MSRLCDDYDQNKKHSALWRGWFPPTVTSCPAKVVTPDIKRKPPGLFKEWPVQKGTARVLISSSSISIGQSSRIRIFEAKYEFGAQKHTVRQFQLFN